MKRPPPALVVYSSSDEDNATADAPIVKKRHLLPSLPRSFLPAVPIDDPSLHQGRRRTTPHVAGQWAAHVYVPVLVEEWDGLCAAIRDASATASEAVSGLVPMGEETGKGKGLELHVSLTRPTYLRAHQREDLKRAVKAAAQNHSAFTASFVRFTSLTNDEQTRTFLAMEVGAGHAEFKALADALTPTLRNIRQKEFYTNPKFHGSFAWALLDVADPCPSSWASSRISTPTPTSTPTPPSPTQSGTTASFPTIPHFPPSLIPELNEKYGAKLSQRTVGSFEVAEIRVRIGKEVSAWKLRDAHTLVGT